MIWFETRLKARREALAHFLAAKPATKAQELRRQALVQRALTSIEGRHQRIAALNDHLAQVEHILTGATESGPTPESTAEPISAKKNLGDL